MTIWTSDPGSSTLPDVVTRVRWWRSIRVRVAVAIALLAALLVGAVGLVLAHLALESGTALLRQQATAQVDAGLAVYGFGGAPAPGVLVEAAKIPHPLLHAIIDEATPGTVTWDDGRVMWAARSAQPTGIIATSVSNAPLLEQASRISGALLWTVGAAVLLSALTAWVVADRLTVRLRDAAGAVNRTIRGEPVAAPRGRDEVDVLTAALASTAAALAARLRREQAFTSDVAHDLRTPLTAVVSATELLDSSPEAERVRRQVSRMRVLVEDLLELARADRLDPASMRPVDLASAAHDATEHAHPGGDFDLRIEQTGTVLADPARLRSAVVNLLQNARQHGRGPFEITVTATSVAVRDHGPGFPQQLLEAGPRRFTALGRSGGSGLGLAIVVEHAHSAGARLVLSNHDAGGAIALLAFERAKPEALA